MTTRDVTKSPGYRSIHAATGAVPDPARQLACKKLRLVAFWCGGKEEHPQPAKASNTPPFQPQISVGQFLRILQPKHRIPAD